MSNILDKVKYQCRVSSVLNRDTTQYGKQYMFDGQEETCWCSDKDSPQWVNLQWEGPLDVTSFQIQFQGGFVGQNCEVIITKDGADEKICEPFYPEDNGSIQTFILLSPHKTRRVMFNFKSSSDFFGRIIIYKLVIL